MPPRPAPAAVDVALVTYAAQPAITADDALLAAALTARGVRVAAVPWDDPAAAWGDVRLAVVRSTWNYHHQRDAFVAWADRVAGLTRLWNPAPAIRWNTHKAYLRDLAARGVPIVPTRWLPAGSAVNLGALLAAEGWERAVLKPAVSASAYETALVSREDPAGGQARLDRLLPRHDMMAQPFLATVATSGERSLLFAGGDFTHAVRRAPTLGAAGAPAAEAAAIDPEPDEPPFARAALAAAGFPTLYARVDLIRDEAGALRLMELELVEPSLFLGFAPDAAQRLADAVLARLAEAPAAPRS
jgi:hypothetical protein